MMVLSNATLPLVTASRISPLFDWLGVTNVASDIRTLVAYPI
jgi:hypothetical protein